ncbi:uncharacterized protein LOC128190523 [Crassostrea angulata]|uniref:uncharacterized protein LOC128190523 n=1 Tax=Magallana angulata TaxID=2784310 RepID=UPI0022B17210|nr:uncharacterized protein LOC128190523 [Crassostrea angulata]
MNPKYAVLHLIAVFSGISFCFSEIQDDGVCDNNGTVPTCCTDYTYDDDMKQCKICVGRFGTDCNQTCPTGHYGRKCIKKCACDSNLCDVVLGCPTTTTGKELERGNLGLFVHLTLSLSAFIIVGLVVVLLRMAYRLNRGARTNHDAIQNRSDITNVGNMTTAAYTSVLCPNRSPVQGVKQNDQMYGDIVIP